MTHFSVLVVGDDVDAALAPYHEYECTGDNNQFVQDVDETAEARELHADCDEGTSFVQFCSDYYGHPTVAHDAPLDTDGEHKFGYIQLNGAGEVAKVVRRTNPNAKWDWYQEGGRFSGKLKLKDGSEADSALIGDVDFEAMKQEKYLDAFNLHERITQIIAGRDVKPWSAFYADVEAKALDIEAARAAYNGQPAIHDLNRDPELRKRWLGASDIAQVLAVPNAPAYAAMKAAEHGATWALLHKGEWVTRGDCGWFGTSDTTDDSLANYLKLFWETVPALPPETRVTVIDCHI